MSESFARRRWSSIVLLLVAASVSACGGGSSPADSVPSPHTPEALVPALLVESDLPGASGGQDIVASSYDSVFDFVPCEAAADLPYMRVPQAEAEWLTNGGGDWQQIVVSSADAHDWYEAVVAAYDRCVEERSDARRLTDAPQVADDSATFDFETARVTVVLSGYDLALVLRLVGSAASAGSDASYDAIVAVVADRLVALAPATPVGGRATPQEQVADGYVDVVATSGVEVDRACAGEVAARLSDEDASVIVAALEYDGSPYYLSDAGRTILEAEMVGCWSRSAITEVVLEVVGDAPGGDEVCVARLVESLPVDDIVALARVGFDLFSPEAAEFVDGLAKCGITPPPIDYQVD